MATSLQQESMSTNEESREQVCLLSVKAQVAVEAASKLGWCHYSGSEGAILEMKTFGASAPLKVLQKEFGFNAAQVIEAAKSRIAGVK